MMKYKHNYYSSKPAFTIVELLVVIVVIGILAAITIVSYTGISNKATVSSLQSDLSNASKLLKMYFVEYSAYPTAPLNNNCPVAPSTVDNKYCLKPSSGNTLSYFPVNGSSPSFTLIATKSTTSYIITDNSAPVSGSGNWIAGLTATALANKWVYNADSSNGISWGPNPGTLASPQGTMGLDPSYPSNTVLVADNSIDFTNYPARNVCKTIGSRLPNMQELFAIQSNKVYYGNNFGNDAYWSATENDTSSAKYVLFSTSGGTYNKGWPRAVRCVVG